MNKPPMYIDEDMLHAWWQSVQKESSYIVYFVKYVNDAGILDIHALCWLGD